MMKKPLLVGHRGVGAAAPENTLPSYNLAGLLGRYWGVECDIHETSDGSFILLHDDTLNDTTDVLSIYKEKARADGLVYAEDLTLGEIKALSVKDRDNPPAYKNIFLYKRVTVPTLEEYLEVCERFSLTPVIEIKQLRNPEGFVSTLEKCGFLHKCVVISFVRPALSAVLELVPDINNQVLFAEGDVIDKPVLDEVVRLGYGGIDIHYGSANAGCVALAHSMGLTVNAWECVPGVTKEEIERVVSTGVDMLTSDTPCL